MDANFPNPNLKNNLPLRDVKIEPVEDEFGDIDYSFAEAAAGIARLVDMGITRDRELFSVAISEDKVVGALWCSFDGNNYEWDVAVLSDNQRCGIGSKLVDVAIARLDEFLDVNPETRMEIRVTSPIMEQMLLRRGFHPTQNSSASALYMQARPLQVSPNMDSEYMLLAQEPIKNRERLQRLVDTALPPIADGKTRLWRADVGEVDAPIPSWMQDTAEMQGAISAGGRWFYKTREDAERHIDGLDGGSLSFVDIASSQVEDFNARDNPHAGGYGRDGYEYFVSRALADSRKSAAAVVFDMQGNPISLSARFSVAGDINLAADPSIKFSYQAALERHDFAAAQRIFDTAFLLNAKSRLAEQGITIEWGEVQYDDTSTKSLHAIKDGAVVAFVDIMPLPTGELGIGQITVEENFRRKGIASDLFTVAKSLNPGLVLHSYDFTEDGTNWADAYRALANPPHKNANFSDNTLIYFDSHAKGAGSEATQVNARSGVALSLDDDELYLKLAKDPSANIAALQAMVDFAAMRAFPDTVAKEPRTSSRDTGVKPLLKLFHGSDDAFTEFKTGLTSVNDYGVLGTVDVQRHGIFFAENEDYARTFSKNGSVLSLFLDIKKPFEISDAQDIVESRNLGDELTEDYHMARWFLSCATQWEAFDDEEGQLFVNWLRKNGYDGARIQERGVGLPGEPSQDIWVALDATQIKSAAPVTFDDSGEPVPLSRRFLPGDDFRGDGRAEVNLPGPSLEGHTAKPARVHSFTKHT